MNTPSFRCTWCFLFGSFGFSTSSATNNPKCTHNRISHSPDLHPWIFVSALLEGYTEPAQKREDHRKKTSSKGLPGAPWVEKGWQQCRGEIPTCLILERRWHTCHRYIYCIPTRSSYTLWHSRIAHNSIRKTSDGVSFLQNIFNDSQILRYQGRHLIFTQETFIFGCVLKSGMPQWWYMMTNHGIWGF